jgi:hypothetical protein
VRVNSAGLRDREHSIDRPEGVYRIAVLGDSYAEAMQVDIKDTFWWLLQEKLTRCAYQPGKRVEVINFGVSASQVERWRASDVVRWLVAGSMLAYPSLPSTAAPAWTIASHVLFAIPLALQWTRWVMVRTYALCLTAFLLLQALLTRSCTAILLRCRRRCAARSTCGEPTCRACLRVFAISPPMNAASG